MSECAMSPKQSLRLALADMVWQHAYDNGEQEPNMRKVFTGGLCANEEAFHVLGILEGATHEDVFGERWTIECACGRSPKYETFAAIQEHQADGHMRP